MTTILGISAYYHDSAAALLRDGKLLAAAQEERFSRRRHDAAFPRHAIDYVLSSAGLSIDDVDYVAYYDKPFLKFERLLETYASVAPSGYSSFRASLPLWIKDKLFLRSEILGELNRQGSRKIDHDKLLFCEHHVSHAASAFYPSPFEESLVLTVDGVGEWATTTVSMCNAKSMTVDRELHFPHSLGLLYSAFTYYLGFKVNSGEYKVMGLAPYGTPRFKSLILDTIVDVKDDGSFRLDQQYFNYCTGLTMTNDRFAAVFGEPVRQPEVDRLTPFHMDIAASLQAVTEEILLKMARALRADYQTKNLCLAGGVALNCVANGKLLRSGLFDGLWIQPAAGDAGGAPGAAWAAWHLELGHPKTPQAQAPGGDGMMGALLGPSYNDEEIRTVLARNGAVFHAVEESEMIALTARHLAEGKAVGWFQGRMEFGPRALGCRSILADPRPKSTQQSLNLKVKFRESFRPFAPAVTREHCSKWFDLDTDSPYMLLVAEVKDEHRVPMTDAQAELFGIDRLNVPRSSIPAVTHVDHSARVQTVDAETNPLFHGLITAFARLTGCEVLVNTSFNIRGEPIVCSPEDAFRCFMGTDLDVLAIGNNVLLKHEQDQALVRDYRHEHDLD